MHYRTIKLIFSFTMLIIGCNKSQPSGYEDPPLFYAAPWVLRYTDTVAVSGTSYETVRIPASGCALTDTIRLLPNEKYVASGSCGPAVNGIWSSTPDSLFGFAIGVISDTPKTMSTAKVQLLTKDSMILIQRSNFRNPDSLFANFVAMRYSH